MTDHPPPASAVATARTPGYDVARALAILGMVLVNYKLRTDAEERATGWPLWFANLLDGRAAALFVVLAGLGIALRSRRAREDPDEHLAFERSALMKRAAVLFAAGLLNLHLWEWDILHCYGLYLLAAAWLLTAPGWLLGVLAVACTVVAQWLQVSFDYDADFDVWSLEGMFLDLSYKGVHPFFPWMSFLLVGMLLGRVDLKSQRPRRWLLAIALVVATLGETVDTVVGRAWVWLELDDATAAMLSTWPKPPQALYVVTATAVAVAVICLCVAITEPRPRSRWVVALTATGQLAFTLYIAHTIAIEVPLSQGLMEEATIGETALYALTFYGVAVAASVWWRRRFRYGPLEGFIRQVTERSGPAPWGGELAGDPPRRD